MVDDDYDDDDDDGDDDNDDDDEVTKRGQSCSGAPKHGLVT